MTVAVFVRERPRKRQTCLVKLSERLCVEVRRRFDDRGEKVDSPQPSLFECAEETTSGRQHLLTTFSKVSDWKCVVPKLVVEVDLLPGQV